MEHEAPSTIDDQTVDELAEAADTDRRSVIRKLAGLPVKGRAGARIDRAIATRFGEGHGSIPGVRFGA